MNLNTPLTSPPECLKIHLRVLKVASRDAQLPLEAPNFHISNTINLYPMDQRKYLDSRLERWLWGQEYLLAPSEHLGLTCNTHMVVDNYP